MTSSGKLVTMPKLADRMWAIGKSHIFASFLFPYHTANRIKNQEKVIFFFINIVFYEIFFKQSSKNT